MAAKKGKIGHVKGSSLKKPSAFKKGVSGKTKSMHSGNKKGVMHSKETGMKHGAKSAGHSMRNAPRGKGTPSGYGF
jgi:hypothetical protein